MLVQVGGVQVNPSHPCPCGRSLATHSRPKPESDDTCIHCGLADERTPMDDVLDAYALLFVPHVDHAVLLRDMAAMAYDAAKTGSTVKASHLLPPPDPSVPVLRARIVALCFAAVAPAFAKHPAT